MARLVAPKVGITSCRGCQVRTVLPSEASIRIQKNRRVLLIDDTSSIHQDFRRVLTAARSVSHLEVDERVLFGEASDSSAERGYEVDFTAQGQQGLEMVMRAAHQRRPYAVVFVDMRMPQGWDGVDTLERIAQVSPPAELCVCSAYSDYSWHEVVRRVGRPGLRLLRKPFDSCELLSVASELVDRWNRQHAGAPFGTSGLGGSTP